MKAGPILALVLLVVIAGAAGYYYLYNFYGLQSSSSTTTPSTSCPPGRVLINGACSNNCANGATDPPSCNVFVGLVAGAVFVGVTTQVKIFTLINTRKACGSDYSQ